ncbi:hypothetical protein DFH07DRAFT_964660 [Mycena maculata]|uniref:Uncharacterized protein n=1 Tax=Mycena maculata TaxID=230809 RepID=A0AAD7IFV3_9AGAR|nr:hypothetical protein DFH07DRAFT_964660 [Mycena maculata]
MSYEEFARDAVNIVQVSSRQVSIASQGQKDFAAAVPLSLGRRLCANNSKQQPEEMFPTDS